MADRFFLSQVPVGDVATLSDDQAHHLINVMRAKVGDAVELFDGRGTTHIAVIDSVSKKSLTLSITDTSNAPDPSRPLTIAAALPKGDRQKFMIEKMVELGVTEFVPLITQRGVAAANEKSMQRIEKQIVEATKQCRRDYLMRLSPATEVDELSQRFAARTICLIADPYAETSLVEQIAGDQPVIVAVGPEGGFTDGETDTLRSSGWSTVSFAPHILRVETAAIAAAAILHSR